MTARKPTAKKGQRGKTSGRAITAKERSAAAIELRKQGCSYSKIGEKLGISGQAAHGLIKRALAKLNAKLEDEAEMLRTLEAERLDELQAAVWPKARKGDCRSVEVALKISERRCRLFGLDGALKQELEHTIAGFPDLATFLALGFEGEPPAPDFQRLEQENPHVSSIDDPRRSE